jgi:uncharacterized protein (DUF1501 family)
MKRRQFLQSSTAAVTLPILLNGMPVSALSRSALFNSMNLDSDKVLVLIQLNGGNDGLSTILPLDQYSNLANARPNILIPDNSALVIEDNIGLHPVLEGVKNLYQEDRLGIVQSVGYPDQNRSHFRSTDIWTSASPSSEFWETGWLGRNFDNNHPSFPEGYPNEDFPDPLAITMGSLVSATCQGVVANYSLAIENPFSLSPLSEGGEDEVPDTPYGDELTFLRQTIAQTNAYSDTILAAANSGSNMAEYPDTRLAEQLKNIALLISGGLQTKIYIASLGGFDTHANQTEDGDPLSGIHTDLLKTFSDAIAAFQNDLTQMGLDERVVGMTFSEFGRRIRSNDSLGTDHGSAAPLILFGSCVNSTILGDNPEIPASVGVQDGVPMQYDFRDVYGSVLMDWFEVPETTIQQLLYDDFQYLPVITDCQAVSTNEAIVGEEASLDVFPNPFRDQCQLRFVSGNERARVSVFDAIGSEIRVLFDRKLSAGKHEVNFDGRGLAPGTYYFRLQLEQGRQKTKAVVRL